METKKYILNKETIAKKIERLAYEIVENNYKEDLIILAGIADNGIFIALELQKVLQQIGVKEVAILTIQINKKAPQQCQIDPQADFNNKVVIIVDDVSMSGKTISYAIKPFLEFYPKKIQTLVLIERQQKSFPIHSDYVGLHMSTTLEDMIIVEQENGELTGAYLI